MSLDHQSIAPAEPSEYEHFGLSARWNERVVTVVATSLAVLIVAAVAVLMGMG